MNHLELADLAKMLAEGPPFAEGARHLAESCRTCGEKYRQIEALMKRFGHWNPEIAVLEGLEADGLFAGLMASGQGSTDWSAQVERNEELHTWGVAWVALERARELFSKDVASKAQARDLALLAAKIAEHLGDSYHPQWVSDLKALAHALAAAAESAGADSIDSRLREAAAAMTALDQGTGDEVVAREVGELLSRIVR